MTTHPHLVDPVSLEDPRWQQGELVEVVISDLSDSGDGVGRVNQRVVFVPDTVPGDRANCMNYWTIPPIASVRAAL
jgi:23S rRNA (uracil1939-C5)-methyltransferase